MNDSKTKDKVIDVLKNIRVGKIFDEYELQSKIANVLNENDISFDKEYKLGKGSRVDFLTHGGVAIEVKKGKPNRESLRSQINRYSEYPEVTSIVIVVETSLRNPITQSSNGKEVTVVGLQKLWGIAL